MPAPEAIAVSAAAAAPSGVDRVSWTDSTKASSAISNSAISAALRIATPTPPARPLNGSSRATEPLLGRIAPGPPGSPLPSSRVPVGGSPAGGGGATTGGGVAGPVVAGGGTVSPPAQPASHMAASTAVAMRRYGLGRCEVGRSVGWRMGRISGDGRRR